MRLRSLGRSGTERGSPYRAGVETVVAPTARRGDGRWRLALAGWLTVVVIALVWGTIAIASDGEQAVRAAPLMGRWRPDVRLALLPAAALGALVVARGAQVAASLSWRRLVVLTATTATVWTALLAVSRGWDRLTAPLTTRQEYEPFAAGIGDVPSFVRGFIDELPAYPTHVRGHPPGAPLVFWALDRLGLPGAGWAALAMVVAWGVAVGAALVALRAVAGDARARSAAPTVAVLPAAIWAGTSFDAFVAGTVGVGACLVVVAATSLPSVGGAHGSGRVHPAVLAVLGGAVLGVAIHLSYGAAPIVLVPIAVLVVRRTLAPLVWAAVGGLVVVGAFTAGGFWWPAGLAATRLEYVSGVATERSWAYFTFAGNPGALLLATGPAWLVGLASLRRDQLVRWAPALGALAAVLVADASGLSKAEVERIWLPFVPPLALLAAAVPTRHRRALLAGQVALALVLQAALASPW